MMPEHLSISNFKKNAYYIFIIIIFIIATYITISFFGYQYKDAASQNKINAFNQKRFEEFYETQNIDLVFLGSSHSYCTFDPEIIDKILDTNSFQMGMPLQHPDASYYTLLEILNYQKPKAVVLEIYWDMLDDDFDLKQSDTLFAVLKNENLKQDYIKNVFPLNEKIKYKINTARYMQDFFSYGNSQLLTFLKDNYNLSSDVKQTIGEEYYRSKGYVYADYIISNDKMDKTNQFKNYNGINYKISNEQKKYIIKIIEKCKAENIQLFFVTAPIANASMGLIKNYDAVRTQINALTSELDVPYIDFNIININEHILSNDNFRDDAHLNHSGVKIISTLYAEYLKTRLN